MFSSADTLPRWRSTVLSIIVSMLLLPGLCGYAAPETPLYSFVPLDCPVAVSVDLPLLWESTAALRNDLMLGGGLRALEAGMGLSIEADLLPWAGQVGFATTSSKPDDPGMAFLVQIRDADRMIAPERLQALLQQMLQGGEGTAWQALDYKGVAIQQAEIARGKSLLKVATATVDEWLVIAVGNSAIRRVIDTRDGSIPSIEKHPLFARATGGPPPAGAIGQFCLNGQGIVSQMEKSKPAAAARYKGTEVEKFFIAGAMSYTNDNLQLDTMYCTSSEKTQARLKGLNADVGTISGASLAELPEGAFATLLLANPDQWFGAFEQILLHFAADPDTREALQHELANFDELRAVLKHCTDEVGVSAAWHEGEGLGLTVAGQTGTDAEAKATAAAISNYLQQLQIPISENQNLYSTPALTDDETVFPMLFCWTARKQWLLGASHPSWLPRQEVRPALELPAFAQDANLAVFGDFSFLQPMMKSMGMDENILEMMSGMKLFTGQWAFAMKIDEDGGAVQCHLSGGLPVVAMSAAVLFPVFSKAREKARQTTSLSNLRQLVLFELMYAQKHNECLPEVKTTEDMKRLMDVPDQLLISPLTNEPYTLNPALSGRPLGEIDNPGTMIVIYEKTPAPDGTRCVAFLDGHVIVIPAVHWETYKQQANIP